MSRRAGCLGAVGRLVVRLWQTRDVPTTRCVPAMREMVAARQLPPRVAPDHLDWPVWDRMQFLNRETLVLEPNRP